MTDQEVEIKMGLHVKLERKITNEVLRLINIAEERKIPLKTGYGSTFDWLTKKFGYSESSAYRRIQAARLLVAVPEAAKKLEDGEVNLSTLAKVQSICRAQEKASGEKVDNAKKLIAIERIQNRSTPEAEQTLFNIFPGAAPELKSERVVPNSLGARLHADMDSEFQNDLQRIKELLSHTFPNCDFMTAMKFVAKDFLKRYDPLLKKSKTHAASTQSFAAAAKPSVKKSSISKLVRRTKIQEASGRCQYRDPSSGKTCGSKHQLQIDHIIPRALGGSDTAENLRCLCRRHNLLVAEQALGESRANHWRKTRPRVD